MRSSSFSRACVVALFATLLLTAITAPASDRRDFAGFYKVSHAEIQGDKVQLTLSLQVHNNGTASVGHAVISLRENNGLDFAGTTKPIALLRSHDHINVTQEFTVSRQEYEKWGNGVQPDLSIRFRANGRTTSETIQVAPRDFQP